MANSDDEHAALSRERAWLREAAAVWPEAERARLVVRGQDRAKFLQSMLTNDVALLALGQGTLACSLTPKGKLVAVARVSVLGDAIELDTERACGEALAAHLRRFIVINKVSVDPAPPSATWAIEGPRAPAALSAAMGAEAGLASLGAYGCVAGAIAGVAVLVQRAAIAGGDGFRVHAEEAAGAAVGQALEAAARGEGGGAIGPTTVERARIEAGFPAWGKELDADTLPPQAGLDVAAISYTKGCYVGQEPIAMLHFRGQKARALRSLILGAGASPPAPGAALFRDGKDVGRVTSSAAGLSGEPPAVLAIVLREGYEPGTELRVGATDGSLARVETPPSLTPPGAQR